MLRLCLFAALVCAWGMGATPALAAPETGDHGGSHDAAAANPMSIDPDLAIWTVVVFVVLLLVLWKFAWGPIAEALEHREKAIADNIAASERAQAEAKQLLVEYEQRLAGAADKVRELLDEARRDAEHTKQEILSEAQKSARAERDRSLREIQIATDKSLKELSERSADLAVALAGKIVRTSLTPQDRARLVQEAMAQFSTSDASQN